MSLTYTVADFDGSMPPRVSEGAKMCEVYVIVSETRD